MTLYVLATEIEFRIPHARSLKDKRQVVKGLLEGIRRRFGVSAAEVDHQDRWQRATLGVAVVASAAHQAEAVIDAVEDHVWDHPELEVIDAVRSWLG